MIAPRENKTCAVIQFHGDMAATKCIRREYTARGVLSGRDVPGRVLVAG